MVYRAKIAPLCAIKRSRASNFKFLDFLDKNCSFKATTARKRHHMFSYHAYNIPMYVSSHQNFQAFKNIHPFKRDSHFRLNCLKLKMGSGLGESHNFTAYTRDPGAQIVNIKMVLGYLYGQKSTLKAYFQYITLTKMNPIIHCGGGLLTGVNLDGNQCAIV